MTVKVTDNIQRNIIKIHETRPWRRPVFAEGHNGIGL